MTTYKQYYEYKQDPDAFDPQWVTDFQTKLAQTAGKDHKVTLPEDIPQLWADWEFKTIKSVSARVFHTWYLLEWDDIFQEMQIKALAVRSVNDYGPAFLYNSLWNHGKNLAIKELRYRGRHITVASVDDSWLTNETLKDIDRFKEPTQQDEYRDVATTQYVEPLERSEDMFLAGAALRASLLAFYIDPFLLDIHVRDYLERIWIRLTPNQLNCIARYAGGIPGKNDSRIMSSILTKYEEKP